MDTAHAVDVNQEAVNLAADGNETAALQVRVLR